MTEFFKGIPERDYHQWEEDSQSRVKKILKSPLHYAEKDDEQTPSMLIGSAFHSRILTPEADDVYISEFKTRKGKGFEKEVEENHDKYVLSSVQGEQVERMMDSFNSHPLALQIMEGHKDLEICGIGEVDGYKIRGRVDVDHPLGVVDLKTTVCAERSEFQRSIYKYGYHIQAYVYTQLWGVEDFFIIATENTGHYITAVYQLDRKAIAKGGEDFRRCIELIAQYKAGELAPTYTGDFEVDTIDLPVWAYNK